ncbi:YybH family protein [Aquimarina spongiae]|uniref:DUF4440 domain-containing protein n=1 Tax=Aquimarina spongiae TaxID=570521 RepID=A0A1M6HE80_9FLAO|nr:hypothetical protein [Aquimarina spongiae]SHJ20502.1 hypothetical protein SAMN04488508_106238 [Aquimarina spongiae]
MKSSNLFILLLLFVCSSCLQKTGKEDTNSSRTDLNPSKIESNEKPKTSNPWLEAVRSKNPNEIRAIYADKSVKVISADSIIFGATSIADYYINQSAEINESESLFLIEANKHEGIDYEIVSYKTKDSEEYVQVVVWKSIEGKKVREFEYDAKRDISIPDGYIDQISKARNLWIQLCNEHNAEHLVSKLYTSNAIYFNHKPLVIGTEAISKEYRYMNSDTYNLTLEPLKTEMVTDNIAFEIGQCKGSYGGKYVIVWQKEAEGNWKVFIDSNF